MNDGFGYWLAGLIDGEGSFNIGRRSAHRSDFTISFKIQMRDDDREILLECQRRTGLGRILGWQCSNPNAGKQTIWRIDKRTECVALIEILNRYPLRTKKLRDYETWKVAVWEAEKPRPLRDWTKIAVLKQRLERERKYPAVVAWPS